jgi:hypothetical protein
MKRTITRISLAAAACVVAMAALASSASADYQGIKIREVHKSASGTADYVVLQMFADGQNTVAGKHLVSYDNAGNEYKDFMFPGNVANGQSQRTILVANGAITPGADFVSAGWGVAGPYGSVCYTDSSKSVGIDCVAYGTTAPPAGPPSPVGTPFDFMGTGLGPDQSILRTIAPNCATSLDAADDTNNSATDFARGNASPRANVTTPSERLCSGPVKPGPVVKKKCKKKHKRSAESAKKKKCKKKKRH